ncbi:FCD domain-containing protein [Streptomyces sp. NPDC046887]|uniref:FadR/GntR family transcriptional regulator n=1 Tax=Streptomyces sp. NPDC046887 TaxID=3155472 RepID=UPI0034020851
MPGSDETSSMLHLAPEASRRVGGLDGPLEAKTTAEQLVDRLVTAIALGSLQVGQKLPPQRELAAQLRVSRTTLREATHLLQDMGYLSISRGRGGGVTVRRAEDQRLGPHIERVLVPRWQEFQHLFDIAHAIHPLIARLAAERRTGEDIDRILIAVTDYEHARDRDELRIADHAVHCTIAAATHNPHYVGLEEQIRNQMSLGTDALPYNDDIRRRALTDHKALFHAIQAQDADQAARLAREHFTDLVEKPLKALHLDSTRA